MPAEAIHLSALSDSILGSSAEKFLSTKATREAAKVGAMFVDLPYFEDFPLVVLKYLLKRPVAVTVWGDRFHDETPIGLGIEFLRGAQKLLEKPSSRTSGEWALAMALGYFSHLAVDSAIHPSVNRLARHRALALQDTAARQHSEVEKFQSILYHEERHGFDFMGEPFLAHYIKTQPEPIWSDSEVSAVIFPSLQKVFGRSVAPKTVKNWASGYRQYGALIASALGKTIAPLKQKEQMRPEVYQNKLEGAFTDKFKVAVWRSRRYLDAALAFAQHQLSEERLLQIAPEGSIDNPPYPSETIEEH
jgi:Zinc dependent phospholipase C